MDHSDGAAASIRETLEKLFISKTDSDITLVVHGEEIKAHKLILTSRSPVLKAMFSSLMTPEDGKHVINDPAITIDDFKNFLNFLYIDQCEINGSNIKALFHLGNMYDVRLLLEKCVEFVKDTFNADNILEYAELGLIYSDTCSLYQQCLESLPRFLKTNDLCYATDNSRKVTWISPELALKIAQEFESFHSGDKFQRSPSMSEDLFFKKVFTWARKQCEINEMGVNPTNIKMILKDILPFIDFEKLEPYTLASIVRDNDLMESEQLLNLLCKKILGRNKSC